MKTKRCSKCKEVKDVIMFHKSKRERDGLMYSCKECRSNKRVEQRLIESGINILKPKIDSPKVGYYSLGSYKEVKAISITELENGRIEVILPSKV